MNRLVGAIVLSALAAACSGGPGASTTPGTPASYAGWPPNATYPLIPVPVSSELVVGPDRLLVNLLDASTNASVAAADHPVQLRLYYLAADAANPALTADGIYMTTISQLPGLYRANVTLDRAGEWGLEAILDPGTANERTGRFIFDVAQSGTSIALGATPPTEDTPTATDAAGIAAISTDDDPDPDFYTTSIADALAAKEPFVVVFATPAFCRSATCGPTLDLVKSAAADFKGHLTFIHVEPYELALSDGHLQPLLDANNNPIPIEAVDDWGLPTEPYVFVVDSAGKVSAKFEGLASLDELTAAFAAVATP
ncbi:MAG TPA: hypothetical protein VM284_03275 [Candidatus Limnocylindria bacterium]|nr:hypothetical protein [Candidatus Limnocylindria bacterium]